MYFPPNILSLTDNRPSRIPALSLTPFVVASHSSAISNYLVGTPLTWNQSAVTLPSQMLSQTGDPLATEASWEWRDQQLMKVGGIGRLPVPWEPLEA